MSMRWRRLLGVPVAAVLVVVGGCAVGGGGDRSTQSKAVVVPPAPLSPARVGGPLVGVAVAAAGALVGPAGRGEDRLRPVAQRVVAR
jgi:hypothetical protein